MQKHAFMVFHKDYHDFIDSLGRLGVLHIVEKKDRSEKESLADLKSSIAKADSAVNKLLKVQEEPDTDTTEKSEQAPNHLPSASEVLVELDNYEKKLEELQNRVSEIQTRIAKQEPWGEYEEADLKKLESAGYKAYLFHSPLRNYNEQWEKDFSVFEIHKNASHIWFILIAPQNIDVDIDAEREIPAGKSLSELKAELETQKEDISGLKKKLSENSSDYIGVLNEEKKRLENELALQEVWLETISETGDSLKILEGWVPAERAEEVQKLADERGVAMIETSPLENEMPPVQLKNSPFSKLFEPISKLFDLPNYQELDLTPYFAPFFMIFFGFCLGDAGYGIVFILLGFILKLKMKKGHQMRPMLTLAQYFGIATIAFGLLSGTFFGINLIDSGYTMTEASLEKLENSQLPNEIILQLKQVEGEYFSSRSEFMETLQSKTSSDISEYRKELITSAEAGIPLVRNFRHLMQDSLSMFYLAIIIGGLQIVFGIFVKILNISRKRGFKYALAPLGWIILIVTLLLYAAGILEGQTGTYVFYGLLGISGVFILLLNNPDINVFARFGGGIWDSYNMVTGLFGDLLSYIRLFALGISSAILGFVFNDISLQLLNIPWIGWLFFLIILLAGHSINLFLATLGGFIHPMRLTFVEFYKNAGFEGGGKEYKPFSINK